MRRLVFVNNLWSVKTCLLFDIFIFPPNDLDPGIGEAGTEEANRGLLEQVDLVQLLSQSSKQ